MDEVLLERFECPAVLVGVDLTIRAANALAREAHRARPGVPCFTAFGLPSGTCVECPVRRAMETKAPCLGEETFPGRDGKGVDMSLWALPIRSGEGDCGEALLLLRPSAGGIRRDLRARLESQAAFVGSITHALKGGINSVEGGLYLLESGRKRGDPGREEAGLDMIRRNVFRARSLVVNVLYFARDREMKPEDLSSGVLVEAALGACRRRAAMEGIALESRVAEVPLRGDPLALQSLLVCLMENALDACSKEGVPQGRRVTVDVKRDPPWAVFEVVHDGPGLDPVTLLGALGSTYLAHGADRGGLWVHAASRVARAHGGILQALDSGGRRMVARIPAPSGPAEDGG